MYNYESKNSGKDNIYQTRLRIAQRMRIDVTTNSSMYCYLMEATLGIILMD